jgi:hypothetical protein
LWNSELLIPKTGYLKKIRVMPFPHICTSIVQLLGTGIVTSLIHVFLKANCKETVSVIDNKLLYNATL